MKQPVHFIIGICLIPTCAALSLTLIQLLHMLALAPVSLHSGGIWWLLGGFTLWLILYLAMPRPTLAYIFGHELTHLLWAWLLGMKAGHLRIRETPAAYRWKAVIFWSRWPPTSFLYIPCWFSCCDLSSSCFTTQAPTNLLARTHRADLVISRHVHPLDAQIAPVGYSTGRAHLLLCHYLFNEHAGQSASGLVFTSVLHLEQLSSMLFHNHLLIFTAEKHLFDC